MKIALDYLLYFLPRGIYCDIVFHPLNAATIAGIVCMILLLLASAFASASEIALFSLSPSEMHRLEEGKGARSQILKRLLSSPERILATILIANNFINISFVIISTFVTNSLINFSGSPVLGFLFQVIIISLMLLLFGEILPKIYATHHALGLSQFMAPALAFLNSLFKPLAILLTSSTSWVNRRMGHRRKNISMHDLSHALELTSTSNTDERDILEGIVKFTNIAVSDIMKPRMDIMASDIRLTFPELITYIIDCGYSRVPVYFETLDNIKGILYIKDLLPHLHKNYSFQWQSLVRPQYYVPETKKISDLLREFQANKIHMAIVIDEFGGTSGLVTLEDILEEIIGEIIDESDEADERRFTKIDEYNYIFEGKISLNDFNKITNTDEAILEDIKGEADTLAGLILELKGEIPVKGEIIPCKGFLFTIESIDKRRIRQIKVTIPK
jgi:putative hemolysin